MSIGEDFAAALAKADVQKARAARVQFLGTLTLAGLESEEQKERSEGTYDANTEGLYKALKGERAKQEAASLASLEQPDAIMRQYVRGLRDGVYSEKFQPVIQQIWTDAYRKQSTRSAVEKAGALASGFGSALVEAAPMFSRGLGAAGAVGVEMTPAAVATGAAAAELGGAESMRLLKGIPRLAEEDVSKEGLQKIFDRDLKELSDIEQVRRYEGKFLKDMAAKAPGLAQTVDTIKATLTEDDLKTVDDLSNIFDPTELLPIGFVVTKVGKAFGLAAKTAGKSKVLARTFKTAEEAAFEAEKLNSTFNKVRKAVGTAMAGAGERVAKSTAGAPVSTFVGGLAAGLPPETAFVAAAVSSYIPRGLRRGIGNVIEATGNVIAKDLPVPWERARQGLVNAGRQALESGAEGMAGNAIFALGASSPEEAGGLLGTGAGLGGATGLTAEGVQRGLGLFDLAANRFNPAERPAEATRQATSRYNEGLDDIHAEAVAKLDNASANAIEQMRNTIVGPEGRLYVVDTPEQAAKIASFYTGQTVSPDQVQSNGFSFLPDQTKQGVGVAVVFSKGEAFAHEPGHLVYNAAKISADPEMRKMAKEIDQKAREVLPKGSDRFNALRDYYNSLLPKGAKRLSGNRVIEEFIVEHFTAVVGGAPLIKFGGDVPLSKSIYDFALTLAEKTGAYQSGLDFSGRSPVTSQTLPIKPSPQLAKLVENMLAARQLDLNKNVPSTLVNGLPGATPAQATAAPAPAAPTPAGVQNVEVVTPPAPQPGFKKGDPIGNITNPQGELVFSGAKVWADSQGPNVRIEGVDASGNIVRADVPRAWLESKAGTAVPPVDVGTAVPVPATLTEQPAVPAPGSISGIPPKAPAPVQKPAPQATPNVRVTETQRQAVVKPTTEQVTENTRRLTEMANRGRTDQGYVQVNYLSAVADEKPADAAKRLEQRRLADAAEANTPNYQNPLRQVYEKVFAPYKPGFTVNTVFGFSFDKLVQNLDIVAGWLSEHPDVKIPYSSPTDPQIRADLRTYLTNSSNGYGGDGTRLVRPEDTIPGTVTPENPNYTPVPLPRERAQFINLLMGLEPAQKMTAGEAYNYRFAKLNGLEPSLTEKGGPEVNPLRAQLKSAGFDSKLLNSVLENLRIDRIGANIIERPDIDLPVVEGAITRAGFMPSAPEGRREIVNVGLKVGDVVKLTKKDVIKAFADEGIALENVQVRESGTEPTVIASVRNADKAAIDRASNTLQQDAIAVYNPADDSGYLAGPRPENFGGKFLKEYFLMPSEEGPAMMPLSKESTERADPFVGQRIVSGWLLSDGQFRWGRNLADHEPLAQFLGFKSIEDLRDNHRAVRVWADGSEKLISFDPDRWNDMSGRQRSSIDDLAIETKAAIRDGRGNIIEDYRDQEASFMPRATKPLKGSLGKGDIKFFHYSDTPNKGAIDPKYFGRSGLTGSREQAGLPRAFAYAEGSTLGQDAGLVDARRHYYEGTAPKGQIYDGVEDALDYAAEPNRAKADQKLIDKGFIGIYREGVDGRKQIEFFQPMSVTEVEKPDTPPALAEEAMPILEPLALEEIDYAAQDREFARKKAAGEPLYMPAPPVESEAFKRWSGGKKVYAADEIDTTNPPRKGVFEVYHGTKADVTEFKAKYPDGLIFTTPDPQFAADWGKNRNLDGRSPRNYPKDVEMQDRARADAMRPADDAPEGDWSKYFDTPEYREPRRAKDAADTNVMKVFANVENAFDPRKDYKIVEPLLRTLEGYDGIIAKGSHKVGNWVVYENKAVVDLLKSKGYDAMWLKESALEDKHDTLAVFSPNQLKSATGNKGTFDPQNPDIRMMPEAPLAGETLKTPRGVLNPAPNTALNLLYSDNPELKAPEGGQKNTGVAKQLMAAAIAENGRKITSKDITPDEEERLSGIVADEAAEALKQTGHAGDWYTKAIERTLKVARVLFPELADDAAAKAAGFPDAKRAELGLMVALAVTSQNLSVPDNARYAVEQFNILKDTGRFDSSRTYGAKGEAISANLDLANTFVERFGWEGLESFIGKNFTVGDLSKALSGILGEEVTIAGRVDDIVQGAAIFGPKIGQGFLQNLRGNLFPVTVDLWLRRTWGRLTGDVMPDAVTSRQLAAMLDAYRKESIPLPPELKTVRVVTRHTKSGKGVRRDLTPDSYERLLETPAALAAIDKLAEDNFSDWNRIYKELRLGLDPQWVVDYREGRVSLEELNRRQQAVLRARDRAWDRHVAKSKRSESDKGRKDAFLAQLDEREGRTAKLSNKDLSAGKPEWAKTTAVVFNARKPIDTPTDQDRAAITRVINRARAMLAERGINATNADLQATIWYPEKDIWAKLRGENESDLKNSYDEEFLKIAESRGRGDAARRALGELRAD